MNDAKKPLGKILLKRKVVSAADLERTLAESAAGIGPSAGLPLASRLLARGLVREADALRGLAEQLGFPAVDLERIGLHTSHLVLDEDFAKANKALVLFVDDTRALVAVAHPDDQAMLATIGAMLSREIVPYVALTLPLHRALEEAYAARKAGKEEYYGRHARTAENRSTLLALATYVPKERPDDEAAVYTDDTIRDASEGETASMREVDATSDAPPESPPSVDLERLLATGARAFREGRQTEGIEMLARAARAHPQSFQAAYQLGLMLGQAGRVHEAISHVEHATTLDPSSFAATKNLAILQEKAGFRGRAVEAWTVARALAPDEATRIRIESHLAKLAGG